jgi:hypothetical protein
MSDTTLMVETVRPSEALVSIYQTAWCNILQDNRLHCSEPSACIEGGQFLMNWVIISFSRTVSCGVRFRSYVTSADISVLFSSFYFGYQIKMFSCLNSNTEYFSMKP